MPRPSETFKAKFRELLMKHGPGGGEYLPSRQLMDLVTDKTDGFVSHSYIDRFKNGHVPTNLNYLRNIADALGEPRTPLIIATGKTVKELEVGDIEHDKERFPELFKEKPIPSLEANLRRWGSFVEQDGLAISTVGCGHLGDREETDGVPVSSLVDYDYILLAEGDSMEPTFHDGAILYIKQLGENEPVIGLPNIIYLKDSFEPTCAYVEPGEWGKYILYKENGEYEEEEVNASECVFQGVVVHYLATPKRKRRKPVK